MICHVGTKKKKHLATDRSNLNQDVSLCALMNLSFNLQKCNKQNSFFVIINLKLVTFHDNFKLFVFVQNKHSLCVNKHVDVNQFQIDHDHHVSVSLSMSTHIDSEFLTSLKDVEILLANLQRVVNSAPMKIPNLICCLGLDHNT